MSNVVVDNVQQDANGLTHVRQLYPDGLTIRDDGTGRITAVAAAPQTTIDDFVPTHGQTAFVLQHLPIGKIQMYVNGALQIEGVDFAISGSNATWLNNGFLLASSDLVVFIYPW